jgi:PAS domain S-box-containing protein
LTPAALWEHANLPPDLAFSLLDEVALPVFVKDRAFRWVALNRAFCELIGFPRAEMLGKTDFDFFPEAEARFFRQKDEELFATGRTVYIDAEPATDSTGRDHVFATTKVPVRDASGNITHLIGVINDITEVSAAFAQLRVVNEQLEERVAERTRLVHSSARLATLGSLAAGLAHQIRNPLGAMLNAASLLKRGLGPSPSPEVAEALSIIEEEAWATNRLISALVEYVRPSPHDPATCAIWGIVDKCLAKVRVPFQTHVTRSGPTANVEVDEPQACLALQAVVQNALDAMPSGGQLGFECHLVEGMVALDIQDSGPGLPAHVVERLFEPLNTTKPRGLGLGLATAQTLLTQQGARLELVASQRGARFRMYLPAAT